MIMQLRQSAFPKCQKVVSLDTSYAGLLVLIEVQGVPFQDCTKFLRP